ncbi:MAG: NUDIX domain-containing protein [Actinomycetia bacterium]|nr:NUDIX domain-containing protein [Actinomycetes bacterium]
MTENTREGYVAEIRQLVGSRPILLPSVSVLVIDDAGRQLLGLHRDSGCWVPPGGSMEPGETPAQAGARETLEETGLKIEPVRLIGVFGGPEFRTHYPNGDIVDHVNTVFEARVVGGKLVPSDELTNLTWYTDAEIDRLDCPSWVAIVRHAAQGFQPLEASEVSP